MAHLLNGSRMLFRGHKFYSCITSAYLVAMVTLSLTEASDKKDASSWKCNWASKPNNDWSSDNGLPHQSTHHLIEGVLQGLVTGPLQLDQSAGDLLLRHGADVRRVRSAAIQVNVLRRRHRQLPGGGGGRKREGGEMGRHYDRTR